MLAYLNPILRGKCGLTQRAVDNWRNHSRDVWLHSHRIKHMMGAIAWTDSDEQDDSAVAYAPAAQPFGVVLEGSGDARYRGLKSVALWHNHYLVYGEIRVPNHG